MNNQVLGIFIGFSGGIFRACLGFLYAKAKLPKIKFNPYLFLVTLIEGMAAGVLLGSMIAVTNLQVAISLGLAAAGLSEVAGKTGFHEIIGVKK